jgi:hypothetical protein
LFEQNELCDGDWHNKLIEVLATAENIWSNSNIDNGEMLCFYMPLSDTQDIMELHRIHTKYAFVHPWRSHARTVAARVEPQFPLPNAPN